MEQNDKDALIAKMNKLKRAYDSYLVKWQEVLEDYIKKSASWTLKDTTELREVVSKLTTTGTIYGYPTITDAARSLEYKIAFANIAFKDGGANPSQNSLLMNELKSLAFLCAQNYAAGEIQRQQGLKEEAENLYYVDESQNSTKTIFIIDDREIIHLTLGGALKEAGFNVSILKDGGEAILKMQEHAPDLFISDRRLPHIDGMTVLRTMRKIQDLATVPVILLTSEYDPADYVGGGRMDLVDFVAKPFDIDEFVIRCIRILQGRSLS